MKAGLLMLAAATVLGAQGALEVKNVKLSQDWPWSNKVKLTYDLSGLAEGELAEVVVTATSGNIMQQGRPFTHGYEVHFEKATIICESFTGTPVTVILGDTQEDAKVEKPEFPAGDDITPFVNELTEARDAFVSGKPSAILDGALARDAVTICHKEIEAVQKRGRVEI